jgi:hypothetical protein
MRFAEDTVATEWIGPQLMPLAEDHGAQLLGHVVSSGFGAYFVIWPLVYGPGGQLFRQSTGGVSRLGTLDENSLRALLTMLDSGAQDPMIWAAW